MSHKISYDKLCSFFSMLPVGLEKDYVKSKRRGEHPTPDALDKIC
jgi:hypothetical protein